MHESSTSPCPFHIGQRLYNQSGTYMGTVSAVGQYTWSSDWVAHTVGHWWATGAEVRSGVTCVGRPAKPVPGDEAHSAWSHHYSEYM